MRKLKLLIITTVMSFCSFSQTLRPIVEILESDTLFCFNLPQSRELAKIITEGIYSDSIAISLSTENQRLYSLMEVKDKQISNLNATIDLKDQVTKNLDQSVISLTQHVEERDRQLRKSKRQKKWLLIGLSSLLIVAAIN